MQKTKETLSNTLAFVAGGRQSMQMIKAGDITRLGLRLVAKVTGGTAVTPKEDGLLRLIKGLTLGEPGKEAYLDINSGVQLHMLNKVQFMDSSTVDALPAATITKTCVADLLYQPGLRSISDPYDPSVVMPAEEASQLELKVIWGDAADLGTGYTIEAANTYLEVTRYDLKFDKKEDRYVYYASMGKGLSQAEKADMLNSYVAATKKPIVPVTTPSQVIDTIDILSAQTNLGLSVKLPLGFVINNTGIMVLDSSGNRSDSEITEIGIKYPRKGSTPSKLSWSAAVAECQQSYNLLTRVTGVAWIRWADVFEATRVGLDLTTANESEVQLAFSTARSGGKIVLIHNMLK